jgi:capsule polysaccharide export protein KpsC/LpsZ
VVKLQAQIIHALALIARATKENPKKAIRAVRHYEALMAQKQKRLQELLNENK